MPLFGTRKKLETQLADQAQQIDDLKRQIGNLVFQSADASEFFSSLATASGASVTAESSKRSAAVYACMRLIAGAISLLPAPIYERTDTGRQRADHDVWWLLNEQPFPAMTASAFWDWIICSLLLRGDGLAQIIRKPNGQIQGFMPLPRDMVIIDKRGDQLAYFVDNGQRKYGLSQDDVLHFPGFGFNGLCGESVIKYAARQSVGTALSADEYAAGYFARGAAPSVAISLPQGATLNKEQAEALRGQLDEIYGGVRNAHRTLVLPNGGKLEPVSLTAEDSQLLETRKFQVIDIARAFGVPPHMIGETSASTSWGTGIEQMSIAFVRYTLGPYLVRIEQELNRKLWPRSTRYFVEFNREGLLAGDSKTESEYLAKALGGPGSQGWMTINEVRRIKNLPPINGGDSIIFAGSQPAMGAQ